jgi:hypothetical protein
LLLAAASLLGLEVRPSADEWCFLPAVRDDGAGAMFDMFYNNHNGRLFNALIVTSYAAPGVIGHQLFPLFSALLTVSVLWALARRIWRVMGWSGPGGLPLLAAVTASVLFLLGTPSTYQTFYWPGANESHTMPPVLACAALWGALAARTRRQRRAALASACLAGACIALLSEETMAVCCAVLATVVLFGRRLFAGGIRSYATKWALCGLAGLAVGMTVLMTSPGMQKRRARFEKGSSPLAPESLWLALQDWVVTLIKILMTWQYVAALAVGVVIGLLTLQARNRSRVFTSARPALLVPLSAAVFLLCGYAAAILVRPAFGGWSSNSVRIRNDYLLLLIVLVMAYGMLLGRALRARVSDGDRGRWAGVAVLCALAVCGVATASLVPPLYELGKEMRVRADQWDRQSAWMHSQAAAGAQTLPYKPLPIEGLREPFQLPSDKDWAASCAARYYRVDTITPSSALP